MIKRIKWDKEKSIVDPNISLDGMARTELKNGNIIISDVTKEEIKGFEKHIEKAKHRAVEIGQSPTDLIIHPDDADRLGLTGYETTIFGLNVFVTTHIPGDVMYLIDRNQVWVIDHAERSIIQRIKSWFSKLGKIIFRGIAWILNFFSDEIDDDVPRPGGK